MLESDFLTKEVVTKAVIFDEGITEGSVCIESKSVVIEPNRAKFRVTTRTVFKYF